MNKEALHDAPHLIFSTPGCPGLNRIITCLNSASRVYGDDLQIGHDLGYAYFKAGKLELARKQFSLLLEKDSVKSHPGFHSMIISNLAICLSEGGFTGRAVQLLEEAIKIAPDNFHAKVKLAMLKGTMEPGYSFVAIKTLKELMAEKKEFEAVIRSTMGRVMLGANRLGEARSEFLRCIQLEPRESQHRANLAALFTHEDMNFRAAWHYLRAAMLSNDWGEERKHLVSLAAAILVGMGLVSGNNAVRS